MLRNSGDSPYLRIEENRFFGIHFVADFVAEHESGIKTLKQDFGIKTYESDESPLDVSRFQISKVPEFVYEEKGEQTLLAKSCNLDLWNCPELRGRFNKSEVVDNFHQFNAQSAWSSEEWAILVHDKENRKYLQQLKDAMERLDLLFFLGGAKLLFNSGLNFLIKSKTPSDILHKMTEGVVNNAKLHKAAKDSGIFELIPKQTYYALSPAWKGSKVKSKCPVIFWLNPVDQHLYNAGWFTWEDLENWMWERGPVIKGAENAG